MNPKQTTPVDANGGIDFSAVLMDFDGEPLRQALTPNSNAGADNDAAEAEHRLGEPITLGIVCQGALVANVQGDQQMTLENKIRMVGLCEYIATAHKCRNSVPLASDEITLLCERVNKVWPNLVAYRAIQLLDPPRIKRRASA
jgi:hypothetical protein